MKNILKHIYSILIDPKSFFKKNSAKIRDKIINDINSVDPTKWYHPPLQDNEICYWGTRKEVNGEFFYEPGKVKLSICLHPDLNYKFMDLPLYTGPEGKYKDLTSKDRDIIRNHFYKIVGPIKI